MASDATHGVRSPITRHMMVGVAMFGTTGVLIGLYLDHWGVVAGGAVLGALLGAGVGRLQAHRFFISVLVGTVVGGLIGWRAGGMGAGPLMAGTGTARGGLVGVAVG